MTKPNHTMTSAAMVVSMVEHRTQKAAETSSTRAMSVVSSLEAQVIPSRQSPLPETARTKLEMPDEKKAKGSLGVLSDQHDHARCPFVYANGKRCEGWVTQIRAYGPWDRKTNDLKFVRKYRLWCSEKYDHAGACSDWIAKERMEFYPGQVSDVLLEWAERKGIVE